MIPRDPVAPCAEATASPAEEGVCRYLPSPFRGLNATWLKLIAVASMLCDHFCCVFITLQMHPLRYIGRLAFPIFAFQIAEGASKTKNCGKYALRLLVFALLSEVPFDLAFSGKAFDPAYQNVFFTLFFSLLTLLTMQALEKKGGAWPVLGLLPLLAGMVICELLHTDYDWSGVLTICAFYLARKIRGRSGLYYPVLLLICLIPCLYWSDYYHTVRFNINELCAVFAMPVLALYNGERGRKVNKYVFYAVYPVHLLLFAAIKLLFFS